jgi:hypothetical protein
MSTAFTSAARRLGIVSAVTTAILLVAYSVTLVIGLATLKSPDDPIGNPWFTMLEIEIIVVMPAIVALFVAVHAWAPDRLKTLSMTAVVFMGVLAGITCTNHFVVMTLSRQTEFADQPWLPLFMTFEWPSVAYAVDIVAWDVFFALAILFTAPVFGGSRLATWIRGLMIASGVLSLAGLSGVVLGSMQWRNIGIVGYVPVFLAVVVLLAVLFRRAAPREA